MGKEPKRSKFWPNSREMLQMGRKSAGSKLMVQMGRKSTGSNPSVFPDSQVIPEWLVLQYFQIHRSYQNAWSFSISRFPGPQKAWSFSISRFTGRKSSFEISKYTFFEICSEIRVSGPSHSIRLVKSVSKNSARAQVNSNFLPKINLLKKNEENRPNSSLPSPLGRFHIKLLLICGSCWHSFP